MSGRFTNRPQSNPGPAACAGPNHRPLYCRGGFSTRPCSFETCADGLKCTGIDSTLGGLETLPYGKVRCTLVALTRHLRCHRRFVNLPCTPLRIKKERPQWWDFVKQLQTQQMDLLGLFLYAL